MGQKCFMFTHHPSCMVHWWARPLIFLSCQVIIYIAGFSNLHFHIAWLPWLLPNDWFSRWLVPPKTMNDAHLGHGAVLGFTYLNPTTSYKFTNKGKFWRNCTRGQIAMRSTSLEGYAWSHGRGHTINRTTHPQFSVQIPMHFTLQFSSANDYARVQLVGIFLEFPSIGWSL
jgi:hypothetical protein